MDWVKEKMYQARLQRDHIQTHGAVAAQNNSLERDLDGAASRPSSFFTLTHKLAWLAGGMALGSVIVIMAWKPELASIDDDLRANGSLRSVAGLQRDAGELPAQFSDADTEGFKKDLILLTEQVQTLTTSVSELQVKLNRIHAVTDSIVALENGPAADASQELVTASDIVTRMETLPSPAAGMRNADPSDGHNTDKPEIASGTPVVAIKEITPAESEIQIQETSIDHGPWVINLASLPRKADAERFVADAGSRGVTAALYQVTVKGKNYWRVHVPGFTTAAEANAKSTLIKEQLGLKDVWVAKR